MQLYTVHAHGVPMLVMSAGTDFPMEDSFTSDPELMKAHRDSQALLKEMDKLTRIIHEKCAIKAKPLISLTPIRTGCLVEFYAMKLLAQAFGGPGRFLVIQ